VTNHLIGHSRNRLDTVSGMSAVSIGLIAKELP